jgi:XRE family transcriptional regulator, regulator of sulfur utilization
MYGFISKMHARENFLSGSYRRNFRPKIRTPNDAGLSSALRDRLVFSVRGRAEVKPIAFSPGLFLVAPRLASMHPLNPMPRFLPLALCACVLSIGSAPAAETPAPAPAKLPSGLYDWEKLTVTNTANGVRRAVFDGPTTTLDKIHCHITTLNPGQRSGEPRKHLQEEVIIVKEGLVEANFDGTAKVGGPGSVIFFAAGATTFLRNAGTTPATYIVLYYYTPLTPKS